MLKNISIKTIFLIDAVGALLSTFILGLVLVKFNNFFKLPNNILLTFFCIAFMLGVYSFTCFFTITKNHNFFLKIIAYLNISYCLFTLVLCLIYFDKLTFFEKIYFFVEIIVILILALWELRIAKKFNLYQK
ncbi:hypothetical protein BTO18_13310 [Polaribacter porphyrae]|uniref:Uncharacterized protein n=1 Tax=Polaribacter porphyrae TaxID=1137780 RepID=A0A2S7WS03_9FLAO|nr:hypothetical protein BTO18_13310 [Polaribacter porphyrae]